MLSGTAWSRRRFIAATTGGLAVIPALNVLGQEPAPRLEESDPTAMAFGYKHDAAAVDTARFPKRATEEGKTQFCDNCLHYKNAEEVDGWAPCAIFVIPGTNPPRYKGVAAKGWCNVWVAQP